MPPRRPCWPWVLAHRRVFRGGLLVHGDRGGRTRAPPLMQFLLSKFFRAFSKRQRGNSHVTRHDATHSADGAGECPFLPPQGLPVTLVSLSPNHTSDFKVSTRHHTCGVYDVCCIPSALLVLPLTFPSHLPRHVSCTSICPAMHVHPPPSNSAFLHNVSNVPYFVRNELTSPLSLVVHDISAGHKTHNLSSILTHIM